MTISTKTVAALVLGAVLAASAVTGAAQAGGIKLNPNIVIKVDPTPKITITPDTPIIVPVKPKVPYIPLPIDWSQFGDKADAPQLMLDCKVAEAGDDLWLVNFGSDEIPSGTKVRYTVPSTGDHGAFLLPRSIDPGKTIKISDLLHGADDGAPCRVQILD